MNFKPFLFASIVMTIALIALSFQPQTLGTGFATCPGCKVLTQPETPDHSLLLIALALSVSIMGAHSLHHFSDHPRTRVMLSCVYALSFIALSVVFGLRLTSPNSAATLIAQESASVFAALGILALFTLAAFELGRFYESKKQYPESIAEDEWDTEKPNLTTSKTR